MWETMYKAEGVGLAAPQIGQSLRLFVVDGSPFGEGDGGDAGCKDFKRVMINPVLFDESDECDVMEEGCLSIPGVREPVERPVGVKVEYYDQDWVLREEALSGIAARIVQHENDHLDGVMIPDYVPVLKKALLQGKLRKSERARYRPTTPYVSATNGDERRLWSCASHRCCSSFPVTRRRTSGCSNNPRDGATGVAPSE